MTIKQALEKARALATANFDSSVRRVDKIAAELMRAYLERGEG